jgi:carbon storage regulator CsrA
MLVLTRKIREAVMVGGAGAFQSLLKVTVLEIAGGRVKLGFEVDGDVPVHRHEIWERLGRAPDLNGREAGPAAPEALRD